MEAAAPLFDELGPRKLFEVLILEVFRKPVPVSLAHVEDYCLSRVVHSGSVLPATLNYLQWSNLVSRNGDCFNSTQQLELIVVKASSDSLPNALAQSLFARLRDSGYFPDVFTSGSIVLDAATKTLYVASSKVPQKYLPLVVLLRNLGALTEPAQGTGLLAVDPQLSGSLSEIAARSPYKATKRKLSLDALKGIQAAQAAQGAKAEDYVVALERARLSGHPRVDLVRTISSEDTSAGYDVISFESNSSLMYDRFIEVKSFKDQPRFYWSRGEREVALALGDSYYLYIVDIDAIDRPQYSPTVIRNPGTNIGDAWSFEPDTWLVTPKP